MPAEACALTIPMPWAEECGDLSVTREERSLLNAKRITIAGHAGNTGGKNAMAMRSRRSENSRAIKFAVVGGAGAVVNTLVLFLLSRWARLPLAPASTLAVELAAVCNYLLHDSWTFAARRPTFQRFAKFNVASLMGLALNVFTVWCLARLGLYFLMANLVGIAAGFTVNYAFSVSWVWGRAA
jgi:putative flippase GtrA